MDTSKYTCSQQSALFITTVVVFFHPKSVQSSTKWHQLLFDLVFWPLAIESESAAGGAEIYLCFYWNWSGIFLRIPAPKQTAFEPERASHLFSFSVHTETLWESGSFTKWEFSVARKHSLNVFKRSKAQKKPAFSKPLGHMWTRPGFICSCDFNKVCSDLKNVHFSSLMSSKWLDMIQFCEILFMWSFFGPR